jgi:Arc/MetJ family transcription regulator
MGPALLRSKHFNDHQLMTQLMPTMGARKMRTTIKIDDELLAKACRLAGPMDRTAVLSEGLKALIERESARRLARLGGTQPELKAAPRNRLKGAV